MSTFNTLFRPAQSNGSNPADQLLLKQFSGEVLRTFQAETKMDRYQRTMTINKGKTYTFNGIGTVSGGYHSPGVALDGQAVPTAEKTVTIDGVYLSPVVLTNYDQALSHFETRAPIVEEMGIALAQNYDRNCVRALIKAARAKTHWMTSRQPGVSGARASVEGSAVTESAPLAGAANARFRLAAAADITATVTNMYAAAEELTVRNCPMSGRFALIRPSLFYAILTSPLAGITSGVAAQLLNRDVGGLGDGRGGVAEVAGFELAMMNPALYEVGNSGPTATVTSGGAGNPAFSGGGTVPLNMTTNSYRVDLTASHYVAAHKSCLATVKLHSIETESEYSVRTQSTLLVAKYCAGHDVLRPEFVIEAIRSGTVAGTAVPSTLTVNGDNT
jgi:hypothetical protein